jgi:protein TonB
MPRDLFGDVTRPSVSIGSRKWYTLPVSLLSHSAIVLFAVAIPILAPAVMPSVFADDDMTLIKVDLPDPPPIPRPKPIEIHDGPPPTGPTAPVEAPAGFAAEKPPIETGWENNTPGSTIDGFVDASVIEALPPPPEIRKPPAPVRAGAVVRTPVKTDHVDPVYPPIAQAARVQGIVIIEATIAEDGRVINARILRSIPLLDGAALEAVRQWHYTPSILNGVPVPVIMTVTVNFTLSK